jgi:hypothetical protein
MQSVRWYHEGPCVGGMNKVHQISSRGPNEWGHWVILWSSRPKFVDVASPIVSQRPGCCRHEVHQMGSRGPDGRGTLSVPVVKWAQAGHCSQSKSVGGPGCAAHGVRWMGWGPRREGRSTKPYGRAGPSTSMLFVQSNHQSPIVSHGPRYGSQGVSPMGSRGPECGHSAMGVMGLESG